ncbi:AraC family transcriptional regulator [Sphingobacterium sp. ML3W]|nr:AraC family transcriptional regulator [Sphingobacterium sp. ML3W]
MTLKLFDNDLSNILIEKEYPDPFLYLEGGIMESTTYLKHPIGKGEYKEIYFEGVHIGFGSASLSDRILLHFESDFETIEMHFALKGKSTAMSETFNKSISFEAHHHNIIYANGMCGKMQWECGDFQLCEINLSPKFFKKFLPQDSALFDEFRNVIEKGNSGLLSNYNSHISHQMYQIIDEIMNCNRQGIFKRMFLEAKVIELLLLQFEQFSDPLIFNTTLRRSDVDKVYAVREFILGNLTSACSLIDLAHKVGTNEFTLKKGFKELFGTSVFAFWNDTKMEEAKLLLTEQNMNITEVSYAIGYKNQRHFSTAFKKKYGILPSQLKK